MKKLLFISEPMNGKTFEEIEKGRVEFRKTLSSEFIPVGTLTDPMFIPTKDNHDEEDFYASSFPVTNEPLYCLAQALDAMSRCDTALFRTGWEKARGCRIEHEVACAYGLEILYEDGYNILNTLGKEDRNNG